VWRVVPALAKNQNGSDQQQTTKKEISRQDVPAPIGVRFKPNIVSNSSRNSCDSNSSFL
jgi:hypothetical protein